MTDRDATGKEPEHNEETFKLPAFDDPKYRAALDDELTDEQATEFLRNLDFILRAFVDLGFGVDAVQLALPGLAEFSAQSESLAEFSGAADSGHGKMDTQNEIFNSAAHDRPQKD